MSERFKIQENKNGSKNTRLPIAEDFANFRFNRDELAHMSRYLFVCEQLIHFSKEMGRPLKVLDIGCGDAYVARTLQGSFVVKKAEVLQEYVGFDIDNKSLERTAETFPKAIPHRLVCGDITNGDLSQFGDKQFDVVVCMETIEHIQPAFVPKLLGEINRVGRLQFISTPNWSGGSGQLPEDHIKEWTYDELRSEILAAGLLVQLEIGVFCNLQHVKRLAKTDTTVAMLYKYLEPLMPADLLSLVMARFIKHESQNVFYVCGLL